MRSILHKATDPLDEERRVPEENELVQVRAPLGRVLRAAPTGEARELAHQMLVEHMREISSRVQDVPDDVLHAEIDEAIKEVRRERQSR